MGMRNGLQMKKRALLHLHPDFLMFSESILLAKKYFEIEEVDCHLGPTLQRKYPRRFLDYLKANEIALRGGFDMELVFSAFSIRLVLSRLRGFFRMLADRKTVSESRRIAIRDSLVRSKFSYGYLVLPVWLRYAVETSMVPWFNVVRFYYRCLFSRGSYSLVIVSHGCYIPYVAVIESALDVGIPVMVSDGVLAYCIKERQETYHGRYYQCNIFRSYERLASKGKDIAIDEMGRESIFREVDMQRCLDSRTSKSVLGIFPHCIKDVNNVSPSKSLVFRNYFEWLWYTTWILAVKRCKYDGIFFKIHPHARRYQDYWMLWLMSRIVECGVNRRKVIRTDKLVKSFWFDVNNGNTSITPVSINGSVVNEAAICGFRSIVPAIGQAFPSAYTYTGSIKEYKNKILAAPNDEIDHDMVISDAKKYRKILEWLKLKKPNILREMQMNFFFDKQVDVNEHLLSQACHAWRELAVFNRVDIDGRVEFFINSKT